MSYTREQLKEARQAKSNLEKKSESKLELGLVILTGVVVVTLILGMASWYRGSCRFSSKLC